MATPKLCTIDGCSKALFAKGWCSTHYSRWRIHGDAAVVLVKEQRRVTGCSIEGCDRPYRRGGLCDFHYMRQYKQGDARWEPKPLLTEPGLAKADPKAYRRLHYQANKVDYLARAAAQPVEQTRRAKAAWRWRNPEMVVQFGRFRKWTQRQATPAWLTAEQWAEIDRLYFEAKRLSAATGVQHHVDHIVPLRGKMVSGLHVPWNMQVATADDNFAKSNRFTG
jgi:hypothetical protein